MRISLKAAFAWRRPKIEFGVFPLLKVFCCEKARRLQECKFLYSLPLPRELNVDATVSSILLRETFAFLQELFSGNREAQECRFLCSLPPGAQLGGHRKENFSQRSGGLVI